MRCAPMVQAVSSSARWISSGGIVRAVIRVASSQEAAQVVFQNLGFHTEALLSGFVKNENGLTEDLVIMSHDSGQLWSF